MLRNRELAKWKEKIRKCQEYRWKVARAIEMLELQKASSKITQQEYEFKLARVLEGKPVSYWNDYYASLISEYKSRISAIRRKQVYTLIIPALLAIALVIFANLGQLTGQVVYTGSSQHGYIDRGGSCNYAPIGLISDTQLDDSIYFSQGPFNGAYAGYNWQAGQDIIYLELGPISEARSSITQVNILWNGRFSKTAGSGKPPSMMAIAYYDWVAGTWTQFDQAGVSQAEETSTLTFTNPSIIQSIVSTETNGFVRLGFQAIGTQEVCNALVLTDYSLLEIISAPITTTSTTTSSSTATSSSTTLTTTTSTTTSSSTSSTVTVVSTSTSTTTVPGEVIVIVASTLGITVDTVYSTADFSTLVIDTFDDTQDNNPLPILIRNEGSVLADVQLSATDLWLSSSRLASDYRFSIDVPDPAVFTNTGAGQPSDSCSPLACFDASGTILVATNMPILPALPVNAIDDLEFTDTNDEVEINIYIHVPNDEPAGSKSSTLTITGVDASTF